MAVKRASRRMLPVSKITFSPRRQTILRAALEFLEDEANQPSTVRQVYYSLVSRHVIDNSRTQYQAVQQLLVDARRSGLVPWEWIEDRLRRPRPVRMWDDLPAFMQTVRGAYRRNVWNTQPGYVEVWLEKDALSGIFEDVLRPYGITLCVGRGFDGWTSVHDAAERYVHRHRSGQDVTVLYFGDFDPSGEDMVRSLRDRLEDRRAFPDIVKSALTLADIEQYALPPDRTKMTDSRRDEFVDRWGDVSVELDALPRPVLQNRILTEIGARMDMDALQETWDQEQSDRDALRRLIDEAA